MDADFEKHYQAAERAYGLGEYAEAQVLTACCGINFKAHLTSTTQAWS